MSGFFLSCNAHRVCHDCRMKRPKKLQLVKTAIRELTTRSLGLAHAAKTREAEATDLGER